MFLFPNHCLKVYIPLISTVFYKTDLEPLLVVAKDPFMLISLDSQ